ncbi:DNA topoisomerase III [Clostridium mediterraneense]|uniref:DNA topoisomerase III n=1 Tax=Clostridium mediterraneense TaxID=1805472 RepID=UPI000836D5CF|nr:DNA topoisomerase III [Clostridium mediterraneense]
MSKILVLAEKPSVGRDLARVLNCKKKGNGFLEGDKYIVTWAMGHLVTLAAPEFYNKEWKDWKMEHLPMLPKHMKLVIIPKTAKQFNAVKSQLTRKDVSEIVIATDAGREGELVARWILEKVHVNKPIKRLWISSVTDKAIKEGFNKLKDGRSYDNLYRAAEARAEADWVVGINATRALTCKHNAQLSCGRVQTPTIAIINSREEEIKNFVPKDYYGLELKADNIKFIWADKSNNTRTYSKEKVEKVLAVVKGQKAVVKEINKTSKKSFSPKLYDLTELQRDCNKMFQYTPKETLSIMQRLYENYKVLTYPRTDSRYLTDDMLGTLKDRVKACAVGSLSKFSVKLMNTEIKANKSFIDNSKVSDHHAIIPTEERANLSLMGDKERKVYELVSKRFLAVLMPAFEYEEVSLNLDVAGETFKAKGKIVKKLGWKEVYSHIEENDDESDLKDQVLPEVKKDDILNISSVKITEGKTKAPARFNEATLLSAMENPAKYMIGESNELKKTIGETGGLGTVATRADIIEKLFNSFMLEKRGNEIIVTSKGKQLLDLAPEELKSPTLTAQWEQKLALIEKGKLNQKDFLQEMRNYSVASIEEIKEANSKYVHDNMTRRKCPECGKYLLEVNGKKGKMLVCQDRECGYRESLTTITNARCPECKKKLELRGHGAGKVYVCTGCGFKEKDAVFKKRFADKKSKVSKKEVNNIMRKMQKEAEQDINNPFADLLKGFK